MFRRVLCTRPLGHESCVIFKGHLQLPSSRNASAVSIGHRPGAAMRRSFSFLTKHCLPVTGQSIGRVGRVVSVSQSHVRRNIASDANNAIRSGGKQRTSVLAEPHTVLQSTGSLNNLEGLEATFVITDDTSLRLKETLQYIAQHYEKKRARNSILKSSQGAELHEDWREAFNILRLEYIFGRYIEAAPAPSVQRINRWTRWDRETTPSNIPEPDNLSTQSFHEYIQRILSLQMTPSVHWLFYPRRTGVNPTTADDHISLVLNKIESLFRNEAFRAYLSTEAFEDAIRFTIRQNELSIARQLLNLMIENKVTIRTSTFNLFLGSAAFHNDLRFFTYILKLKQSLKIPSDGHTWARYLGTLLSARAKLSVFREMEQIGLFRDPTALQYCIAEIVEAELQAELKKNPRTNIALWSVVERFDAKFGPQWVSAMSLNKFCAHLGASGLIGQIPRLLTTMEARKCKPDSETLSLLIYQASLMRRNGLVLAVIKLFQARYTLRPRREDFNYMFQAAWDTRSFNTCRLLWRLACGLGFVTPTMRRLVYQSLVRNTPQHAVTAEQRWWKEAGRVIVFSRPENSQIKNLIDDEADDLFAGGDKRGEQLTLAHDIIRRDRLARLRGSFKGDWVPLYERAVQRDQQWAEKNVLTLQSLQWKLRHGLRLGHLGSKKVPAKVPEKAPRALIKKIKTKSSRKPSRRAARHVSL